MVNKKWLAKYPKLVNPPVDSCIAIQCVRIGILDQELAFGRVDNGYAEAEHNRDDVECIRNRIEEGKVDDAA